MARSGCYVLVLLKAVSGSLVHLDSYGNEWPMEKVLRRYSIKQQRVGSYPRPMNSPVCERSVWIIEDTFLPLSNSLTTFLSTYYDAYQRRALKLKDIMLVVVNLRHLGDISSSCW